MSLFPTVEGDEFGSWAVRQRRTLDEAVQALQEAARKFDGDPDDALAFLFIRKSEAFLLISEFCREIRTDKYGWDRLLRVLIAGDTATRDAAIQAHFHSIATSDLLHKEADRLWMDPGAEMPFGMKR